MCTMEAVSTICDGDFAARKSNKPLMEKKRRQRINRCLNDLKSLVLEALKKDPSRYSKLEKADILEMTVRHIQALHRHESANGGISKYSQLTTSNVRSLGVDEKAKYRAGFNQCAVEVTRYLSGMCGVPRDLHSKIVSHLNSISNSFPGFQHPQQPNGSSRLMIGASVGTVVPPVTTSLPTSSPVVSTAADSSTVSIPDSSPGCTETISDHKIPQNFSFAPLKSMETANDRASVTVSAGVTLVPARLANGQMALVLPPGTAIPIKNQNQNSDSLSYANGKVPEYHERIHVEDLNKNQTFGTTPVQLKSYNTDKLSLSSIAQEAQNSIPSSSNQGTCQYQDINNKATFNQYYHIKDSSTSYNSQAPPESNRHIEAHLQISSFNDENPRCSTSDMSLPLDRSLQENMLPSTKENTPRSEVSSNEVASLCSHVAVSVSRQNPVDSLTSNTPGLVSGQTVLIKPKPQLPAGIFSLRKNEREMEQNMKFSFRLPSSTASHGIDFNSQCITNQEPLNLVVTDDDQRQQTSTTQLITSPSSVLPLQYPPLSPSSLSSSSSSSLSSPPPPSTPQSSSSSLSISLPQPSSSSSVPQPLPQLSPSSFSPCPQLQLSLQPSTSGLVMTNALSPAKSIQQLPSSSSALKAKSSHQSKKRFAPYERIRTESNEESSPWRPW